jgi:hypothetical protein
MAEEYPQEAYFATFADLSDKEKAPYKGKEPPPAQIMASAGELTPAGSRLYRIRNRTINSLAIPQSGYALDSTTPYPWGWTMVWYGCGAT